jgi:hypothetical protein
MSSFDEAPRAKTFPVDGVYSKAYVAVASVRKHCLTRAVSPLEKAMPEPSPN